MFCLWEKEKGELAWGQRVDGSFRSKGEGPGGETPGLQGIQGPVLAKWNTLLLRQR